jgi:hypothetical protein
MRSTFPFRLLRFLLWAALLSAAAMLAFALFRPAPEDLPWTPLELDRPIGLSTGRKLAALSGQPDQCRALLEQAGLQFSPVPAFGSDQCRVTDAVRVAGSQEMLAFSPADVAPSCSVIAATAVWTWQVVQPAAQRLLGASLARLEHMGSYSCRRLYGRSEGGWSEHATANALDIGAFILTDGRRISVVGDWAGDGPEAAFLREVRDGACKLFSTVLSPDYNRQHQDHFHLDQADRGTMGWRACR